MLALILCYASSLLLPSSSFAELEYPIAGGSKIKARQRSVARQIKSTLPGFYSDKLALIYTLT